MAIAYPTQPPAPRPRPRRVPQPRYPKRTLPGRPWTPPRPGPTPMPRYPLQPRFPFRVSPPLPVKPYRLPWWVKLPARGLPLIGWGLAGYELYNWWNATPGVPAHYDMTGWTQICKNDWSPNVACAGGPYGGAGVLFTTAANTPRCGQALQPFWYAYGTPIPAGSGWANYRTVYFGPINPIGGCALRMTIEEQWTLAGPNNDAAPLPLWVPESPPIPAPGLPPVYVPPWVPWFDPMQLPIHQPVPAPRPLPWPLRNPAPHEKPAPRPLALPPVGPSEMPSLDVEPGAPPAPKPHEVRKPEPGEKERKGKLRGPGAVQYLRAMEGMMSKWMELDDLANAVYKSLHWKVRRWKGRDGVWRDRDITTAARLQRIADELGTLKFNDLVKNLAAEYATDRLGGVLGELNRQATAGSYYRGARGLQSGGRFTKASWDEALEQLRLGAAQAQQPKDYYRWSYVHPDGNFLWSEPDYDGVMTPQGYVKSPYWDLPPGGRWVRRLVKGRKQIIPWFQYTYQKRVTNPRRGTAEWWRRQSIGIAFRETAAYRRNYG